MSSWMLSLKEEQNDGIVNAGLKCRPEQRRREYEAKW